MVFAFLRDAYNYYFGNRYPRRGLVATLTERSGGEAPASTALVKYSFKPIPIIRQPILRPIEEDEHEAWVETHPSQSVSSVSKFMKSSE